MIPQLKLSNPRTQTVPTMPSLVESAWRAFAAQVRAKLPDVEVWPDDAPTGAAKPGAVGDRPRVELWPMPGTPSPRCVSAAGLIQDMPFGVEVVCRVAGADPAASARLWERVLAAVYLVDEAERLAFRRRMGRVGVNRWLVGKSAWTSDAAEGATNLVADGRFDLDLAYVTPL